jgi:lipopolysaccharide transport system permease protein
MHCPVLAMSGGLYFNLLEKYRSAECPVNRNVLFLVQFFQKRYSGAVLGIFWIILYPILLLGIYLFVYMVVFKMRLPGQSQIDYVIYVFSGLIPYIGFMDSVNGGCHAIRQNIHLVKNVMLPIELIPVRYVSVSLTSQAISMTLLLLLMLFNQSLGWGMLLLPLAFLLQLMFLTGLVWILSALNVAMSDTSHFVGLFTLMLIFITPIGFTPDMVPDGFQFMIYLNPVYYLVEMFRFILVYGQVPETGFMVIAVLMSVITFIAGATFFRKFKNILVDYE